MCPIILARLPTETAGVFFSESLFKKETVFSSFCFSYMFNASTKLFWIFSFAQSRKILSKFSNLSAILKHRGLGGKAVIMTSVVGLSTNRS